MSAIGEGHVALLIPVEGPVQELILDGTLEQLQSAVGGNIEALPIPRAFDPSGQSTAYVNEEGKYECRNEDGSPQVNWRATDFMVPGVGLFPRDYIAGPMLLCGFSIQTGAHDVPLPEQVVKRVRLIEREAGR